MTQRFRKATDDVYAEQYAGPGRIRVGEAVPALPVSVTWSPGYDPDALVPLFRGTRVRPGDWFVTECGTGGTTLVSGEEFCYRYQPVEARPGLTVVPGMTQQEVENIDLACPTKGH